jgi:uncharacterized protein (TIGR02246 family)
MQAEKTMQDDEQAIRDLVNTWMTLSSKGDVEAVLKLMSDDVVFMVTGKEPFGKQEFAAMNKGMRGVRVEGTSDIKELKVLGDWAWMRNFLRVKVTPAEGIPMVSSGYTLTILRKNPDGRWVVARDANLLTSEPDGAD